MDELCELCGYEMTNPRCIGCLRKSIMKWSKNCKDFEKCFKMAVSILKKYETDQVRCIRCKKQASVCSYCFRKVMNEITDENRFSNIINNRYDSTIPVSQSLY